MRDLFGGGDDPLKVKGRPTRNRPSLNPQHPPGCCATDSAAKGLSALALPAQADGAPVGRVVTVDGQVMTRDDDEIDRLIWTEFSPGACPLNILQRRGAGRVGPAR